jgi:hypothetical protein
MMFLHYVHQLEDYLDEILRDWHHYRLAQVRQLKTIFANFLAEVGERRTHGGICIQKSM